MNTKQKALLSATCPNTVPHHNKMVLLRKGTVNFFNTGKGYGSVRDSLTRQDYIVYKAFHGETISAQDYVSFELYSTPSGELTAISVRRIG